MTAKDMQIRKALESDLDDVLYIERVAFGQDEEAELVHSLLHDASAKPVLSLLAFMEGKAVGHVLFTRARLEEAESEVSAALLAPLAILPEAQNQGIGGRLINRGFELLAESGVDIVFVLGHTKYYPRFGFTPAGVLGFEAPYSIPDEHADAWMVHALRPGVIGSVKGRVICADALSKPEYWLE